MKSLSKTLLIISLLSATTNAYAQDSIGTAFKTITETAKRYVVDFPSQIQNGKNNEQHNAQLQQEYLEQRRQEEIQREQERMEEERRRAQLQQEYLEQREQESIQRYQEIGRQRELSLQRYKEEEAQREKERMEQERQEKIKQEEEIIQRQFDMFVEFYPSKRMKVRGRCTDESRCRVKEYYEEGQLKSELNYKSGIRQIQEQTAWYGDCSFEDSEYYISYGDTKENGICTDYYENGEIKLKRTCEDGDCTLLGYYENRNLQKEEYYKLNRKDGVQKTYYESGALQAENNYKNGKLEGVQKGYYESGALKTEDTYKSDKLEGIQKAYYESGALQAEINCKDGKKEGLQKTYYESGQLKKEGNVIHDKRDGVLKFYNESGTIISEENYKNGEKDGIQKEYYDDGTLKSEDEYAAGKRYGIKKEYYESGKLKAETSYKNDKKYGVEKEYFQSGALHIEANFKDDILDGNQKEYNESGNLISEADYKNGNVQGVVVEYSEDGKWKFVNIYNYLKYYTPYVWDFIKKYSKEISTIILSLLLLWGIIRITPWVKRTYTNAKNNAIRKVENAKSYIKNKRDNLIDKCKETKNITTGKISTFKSYAKDKSFNLLQEDKKSNVIQLNKKGIFLILGMFIIAVLFTYKFSDKNANVESIIGKAETKQQGSNVENTEKGYNTEKEYIDEMWKIYTNPSEYKSLPESKKVAVCLGMHTQKMICENPKFEPNQKTSLAFHFYRARYMMKYKIKPDDRDGMVGSLMIVSVSKIDGIDDSQCKNMSAVNKVYKEFCASYISELKYFN